MIITVKNLQQETFRVITSAEKTVRELKQQIFDERGSEYNVERQKLIYAGVILEDDRTIASYKVDEKKFVVVLLKRDLGGSGQKPEDTGPPIVLTTSTETSGEAEPALGANNTPVHVKSADIVMTEAANEDKPDLDEDTKSIGSSGSGGSGGTPIVGPIGSGTSIVSTESETSVRSCGSGNSNYSQFTYSSGDLAGVFSSTSLQSRAESNLLMGEEYNRSVESMIEMGYSREMVERAMAASFNNPERAVEYLIAGIPETEDGFNASTAAAGECAIMRGGAGDNAVIGGGGRDVRVIGDGGSGDNTVIGSGGSSTNIAGGAGSEISAGARSRDDGAGNSCDIIIPPESDAATSLTDCEPLEGVDSGGVTVEQRRIGDPFEFLRNQPQFRQMRSLVYQNPDLLQAVLEQIGQTNPALLQLISEHQDAFLTMLNQPMEGQPNISTVYPRRMTPGRRAQLAAAARAAASGDGPHVRPLDTAPGAGGDGPPLRSRPAESGDAGADTVPPEPRPDRFAERRTAAADAFMRERAAAAAAVAALTAAASDAVDREAVDHSAVDQESGSGGRSARSDQITDNLQNSDSSVIAEGNGVATIRLTPQDQDAIERLMALGFPEALVLQAYFACEKDEQLTANFLISSTFDD